MGRACSYGICVSKHGRKKKPAASAIPGGGRMPVVGVEVAGGRRPAVARTPQSDPTISWRVGSMDVDGRWGWAGLDGDTVRLVHQKLAAFETMTWGELTKDKSNNKQIPVGNLCSEAQQRLTELRLDDQDALWQFRLGGRQRVWGWRAADVLHLLWWDPEHEVCPSAKR